jgi:hypothetical protein
MHNHDRPCPFGYSIFNTVSIYLKRIPIGLDQDWHQPTLGDSEYRSEIGIGRKNHLIARRKNAHLHIGSIYQLKGIKAVPHTYATTATYIPGILLLKQAYLRPPYIHAGGKHTLHCLQHALLIRKIDVTQIERNHCYFPMQ